MSVSKKKKASEKSRNKRKDQPEPSSPVCYINSDEISEAYKLEVMKKKKDPR
ncbi:MAG: hypothetical protein ACFHWX_09455 [Bacteroidota bacterium]